MVLVKFDGSVSTQIKPVKVLYVSLYIFTSLYGHRWFLCSCVSLCISFVSLCGCCVSLYISLFLDFFLKVFLSLCDSTSKEATRKHGRSTAGYDTPLYLKH